MNKKSKEIVKKLCFTLVIVISIITIIGCPNTVSNKTKSESTEQNKPNPPTPPLPTDPNDWSGLTADQVIQKMKIEGINDDVVTDLDGLGFGLRDGKLCLSSGKIGDLKGTSKSLFDAKTEIENEIGASVYCPTENYYSSIVDGLKKRWEDAKETQLRSSVTKKWLYFSDGSASELDNYLSNKLKDKENMLKNKALYEFANKSQYFAVDRKMDLFVYLGIGGTIFFADWHIVFVETEGSEMYSFHYGPYTLNGECDNNNPKVPINHDKKVHVFTLSEMLKDYLKKKGKGAIADKVVEKFPPLLPKNKDKYDVYLVIGKVFHRSSTFCCYESLDCSFRNVLKLSGDAYGERWHNCWSNDESDKDGFPSLLP
jgi:hypothetical protein